MKLRARLGRSASRSRTTARTSRAGWPPATVSGDGLVCRSPRKRWIGLTGEPRARVARDTAAGHMRASCGRHLPAGYTASKVEHESAAGVRCRTRTSSSRTCTAADALLPGAEDFSAADGPAQDCRARRSAGRRSAPRIAMLVGAPTMRSSGVGLRPAARGLGGWCGAGGRAEGDRQPCRLLGLVAQVTRVQERTTRWTSRPGQVTAARLARQSAFQPGRPGRPGNAPAQPLPDGQGRRRTWGPSTRTRAAPHQL
ncbi:hypothetical protein QJS66_07115 [Kocuria rhizophila]|nr:hypothetical protein QJS66_07115 [Kocuria rhizophila]